MLYQLLIQPLESLFAWLFGLFYRLIGNYGVSIALLSATVNLLLWPLYRLAERLKESEKSDKEAMTAELLNISGYSGAEKHYYRSYIYHRHRYHPLKSLRVSLGLLLQIPFFIAAYQFLSHYDDFSGTSFLFIADLARSDALLAGINLLPFVMTLLNLAAAAVYSAGMDKSSRNQLYALSALFLFLLYDSAAAAVFYWSVNNFIALAKGILKQVNNKKISYSVFKIKLLKFVPSFDNISPFFRVQLLILPLLAYSALIFILLPSYSSVISHAISEYMLSVSLLFFLVAVLPFFKFRTGKLADKLTLLSLSLFTTALILLAGNYIFQFGFWTLAGKWAKVWIIWLLAAMSIILVVVRHGFYKRQLVLILQLEVSGKQIGKLAVLAQSALLWFVFFYPSLNLIASSPTEFSFVETIFSTLTVSIVTVNALLIVITKKAPNSVTKLLFFLSLFLLFLTSVYYFLLPGDYGLMDFFIFHNGNKILLTAELFYRDNLLILSLLSATCLLWKKQTPKMVFVLLLIFVITTVSSSLPAIYRVVNKTIAAKEYPEVSVNSADQLEPHFFLSSEGKNVLVIFFDRFIGGFIPRIFAEDPGLADFYSGFTWYPNVLSFAGSTMVGLPPIYGGYSYCDVDYIRSIKSNFAELDTQVTLDHIEQATTFTIKKFLNTGYRTFINDPPFLGGRWHGDPSIIERLSADSHSANLQNSYTELLFADYLRNKVQKESESRSAFSLLRQNLLPYSLFRTSPHSLRPFLYNSGYWWGNEQTKINVGHGFFSNLAYATVWPMISQVERNLRGSYIFVSNDMTHNIFSAIDSALMRELLPENNATMHGKEHFLFNLSRKTVTNDGFASQYDFAHFFADRLALIKTAVWLQWLQDNDVYDNTMIVLVSDHGFSGIDNPMFGANQKSADGFHYGAHHPLLMVKNFNADGKLLIDNRFMTNADVPAITLSAIDPQAGEKYGYDKSQGFRLYTDKGNLTVYDNIFEPDNWVYSADDK